MTSDATLTTRTIGETESALNGLLFKVLGDTGLDELGWVAMRLVSLMPPPVTAAGLTTQLRDSRKVDEAAATEVLADLEGRGFIQRFGDNISTTPEGARIFEDLSGEVGKLTAHMWAGLDSADLATAARVLTTITQRANALLAG
jgi:DNA-binding MarR family transcriptional regulator